jgi:DNA invertase Pin-like site-specific DNA recombinase
MSTNGVRAAIYLRVSRDDQTTENQRLVLAKVAEHRGWLIVQTYEDQGISGAKGRDQRPAFDAMLKDAVRRRFDALMVWSIDRLGRTVLHRGKCPSRTRCCWRGALFRPAGDLSLAKESA